MTRRAETRAIGLVVLGCRDLAFNKTHRIDGAVNLNVSKADP